MRYIKKLAEKELWNAGKVELWDFSRANENEESRIDAVATAASICYGKPPKDAKKLVERLWTESGGLPSSAFEFVRCGEMPYIEDSLRNMPELPYNYEGFGDEDENAYMSTVMHRENIATFRLKVPIFIARQVMRHRQFSYQELSRRYTTDERVPLEFWGQGDMLGDGLGFLDDYKDVLHVTTWTYQEALKHGVRPEIARAVLPQALYTEFWMMGDQGAWKNYFALRTDKHTQKEHRELAEAMLGLLKEHQSELYGRVKPE